MAVTQNATRDAGSAVPLLRVRHFGPALAATLIATLSEAMAGSYMALLAVEKIGMSPLALSAFLTTNALSGFVVTTIFGHLHDRRPVMWPLLVSLAAKAAGFGLCAVLTQTWMFIVNAAVLFGLSSASYALLFALSKGYLDSAGGVTVSRGMATLRLASSLSWAIGPAIGAALVSWQGFEGVYLGAAALAACCFVTVIVSRMQVLPADVEARQVLNMATFLRAAPAMVALSAFHTAMFMGSNAMAIVVARQLGSADDVGLLFSLCAGLEVVVMGAFVAWPGLSGSRPLLVFGFALYTGYFILALAWPTLMSLYIGQGLRAAAIGIISIVGMAAVQDMLPGRAGAASAVFGNTVSVGLLLSGLGTGLWANWFGYWSIFWLCGGLCAVGGAAIVFGWSRHEG
jgi:SET family sugar efflux transporter-like MFS transporter